MDVDIYGTLNQNSMRLVANNFQQETDKLYI